MDSDFNAWQTGFSVLTAESDALMAVFDASLAGSNFQAAGNRVLRFGRDNRHDETPHRHCNWQTVHGTPAQFSLYPLPPGLVSNKACCGNDLLTATLFKFSFVSIKASGSAFQN